MDLRRPGDSLRASVAAFCVMSLSISDPKLDDVGYLLKHETGSQRYLPCIMQCPRRVFETGPPRKLIKAVRACQRRSGVAKHQV